MMNKQDYLSIAEAACALGVSRRHVYNLIRRGDLIAWRHPTYRKGGPVRIPRQQIETLLSHGGANIHGPTLPTPDV